MDFYKLTPKDAQAIRQGNTLCIYYGKRYDATCVVTQDAPRDEPFGRELRYDMAVPVTLRGYHHDGRGSVSTYFGDAYAHASAFAHIRLYDFAKGPLSLLKAGDEIAFAFSHDNNTGYTRSAGLHVDSVSLVIKKAKGDVTLLLETSICPNNSARMVRDVAYPVRAEA